MEVKNNLVIDRQYATEYKQNALTDNLWVITDKNTSEKIEVDVSFKQCSDYWANWGRRLLLEWGGGYTDEEQNISCNAQSFKNQVMRIYPISFWASLNMEDKPVSTWSISNVTSLFRSLIFNEIKTPTRTIKDTQLDYRKKGTVAKQLAILVKSGEFYRQGKIPDGLIENLPNDFIENIAEKEFKNRGGWEEFEEWLEDGSFAHIPIELSITLLSQAIEIIRSERTNALISYFKAQKGNYAQPLSNLIKRDSGHDSSYFEILGIISENNVRKTYTTWVNDIESTFSSLEKKQGRSVKVSALKTLFDIKNADQLSRELTSIYEACLIIFLCLTGVRIHEIREINANDYDVEPDGTWFFRNAINKTHNGVEQVRTMSGLVAEAATVLCDLSYIDKTNSELHGDVKLFSRHDTRVNHSKRNKKVSFSPRWISREYLASRVNLFFKKVKSKIGKSGQFDDIDSISPHGFRHAFADFAIRRFDGNVLEAIRQHFRHKHGSSFTRAYTDNKAKEQFHDAAAKRYLRELIKRMVGENSKDFTGAMALYIRNEVKRLNIVGEDELNTYIDSISENLDHLVPHEYGFCLVLNERQHLAECKDKKTGMANVGGAKFEWCSRCPNSFQSVQSNKSNIERIVISHESFLEKFPIKTKQHSTSEKVVKQGLDILNNMGES